MRKKIKSLSSIFLALLIMMLTATTVSSVEPRFSDTHSVIILLSISNTTATCQVEVEGANGTTSIKDGCLILKDSKENIIGNWTNLSSSGSTMSVSKTVENLVKGETYTLTFSANVIRNGRTEPISGSKSKTCPNK